MIGALPLILAALATLALPSATAAAPEPPAALSPMLTGGWTPIPTPAADAQVRAAARAALSHMPHHPRLRRIESAERQVVAGMNYRLVLRLTNGQRWSATVWSKLDGAMVVSEMRPYGRTTL